MPTLINFVTNSRIWRSFFRHGWPDNPLDRSLVMTSNIFFHLHPVKVSRRSLKATYTLGLGILTALLFVELTLTGVLLMFYYVPSVERAYVDIVELQTQVPFGQLLRNLHRWGAHLMVLTTVLHMARVFYTGAYKPPREFNWGVGVLLLILTLAASFTGYLLPWDQIAYWAITVGTSVASYEPIAGPTIRNILLGGPEVGQEALTRFYALHIMVVPLVMATLIALHVWRVRKDGGLAATETISDEDEPQDEVFLKSPTKTYSLVELVRAPTTMVDKGPEETVFTFPIVPILELLLALGLSVFLILVSLLKNAPLEAMANPLVVPEPAKAPWYLVGGQEMLEHIYPALSGVIMPAAMILFLLAIPYLDQDRVGAGHWFTSARGKRIALWTAAYALLVMPAFILADTYFPPRELLRGIVAPFVYLAIIPGAVMALIVLLPVFVLWRRSPGGATAREVITVLFTTLMVSAAIMSITGFLFRGPGYQLYWPWAMPDGYNPLAHF